MIRVGNNLLVVKPWSVITKNIRFDGTVVAGINCSFLGSIEAREVVLARGCVVGGKVVAEEVVLGAATQFDEIRAWKVSLMRKCRGRKIVAEGDVKVAKNCIVGEIFAGNRLLIEGNSKIGRMEARKIVAYG